MATNIDAPVRIAAIGGGTGLASLLRALKPNAERESRPWRMTGIVAVSDDGGSSGRLREELGVIPPGDLRNCLSALGPEKSVLGDLLDYRFSSSGPLGGHSLGNLMLSAMADVCGSWVAAIRQLSDVLVTVGKLYPATLAQMTLFAEDAKGKKYKGESSINHCSPPLKKLWLEPQDAEAIPEAILAILHADAIILAPGSLYTSTIPNLLLSEIRTAIGQAGAPLLYVANLVAEPGESHGLSLADHIDAIQRFGRVKLSAVLANETPLSPPVLAKYAKEGGEQLFADAKANCGVSVISKPLLDAESELARHSPELLNAAIEEWLLGINLTKA
ncbi:MAG: uridine diphosphate-N-acetylglucosamine-binding protein YvcK [Holophagales bacterium]|nr:uridine diphosphate-N-acetylglucosamine-binding protein YvcK [Holophagales bacterium]